jgi:hypothetical protein
MKTCRIVLGVLASVVAMACGKAQLVHLSYTITDGIYGEDNGFTYQLSPWPGVVQFDLYYNPFVKGSGGVYLFSDPKAYWTAKADIIDHGTPKSFTFDSSIDEIDVGPAGSPFATDGAYSINADQGVWHLNIGFMPTLTPPNSLPTNPFIPATDWNEWYIYWDPTGDGGLISNLYVPLNNPTVEMISPVPETATYGWVAGLALLGLVGWRRLFTRIPNAGEIISS